MSDNTPTTTCCPECQSSAIKSPSSHVTRSRDVNAWSCRDCSAEFDKPDDRPTVDGRPTSPPAHTLAATLDQMSVEEFEEVADV